MTYNITKYQEEKHDGLMNEIMSLCEDIATASVPAASRRVTEFDAERYEIVRSNQETLEVSTYMAKLEYIKTVLEDVQSALAANDEAETE